MLPSVAVNVERSARGCCPRERRRTLQAALPEVVRERRLRSTSERVPRRSPRRRSGSTRSAASPATSGSDERWRRASGRRATSPPRPAVRSLRTATDSANTSALGTARRAVAVDVTPCDTIVPGPGRASSASRLFGVPSRRARQHRAHAERRERPAGMPRPAASRFFARLERADRQHVAATKRRGASRLARVARRPGRRRRASGVTCTAMTGRCRRRWRSLAVLCDGTRSRRRVSPPREARPDTSHRQLPWEQFREPFERQVVDRHDEALVVADRRNGRRVGRMDHVGAAAKAMREEPDGRGGPTMDTAVRIVPRDDDRRSTDRATSEVAGAPGRSERQGRSTDRPAGSAGTAPTRTCRSRRAHRPRAGRCGTRPSPGGLDASQPSGPTVAACSVPGSRSNRSPAMSSTSPSLVWKTIDPAKQKSTL